MSDRKTTIKETKLFLEDAQKDVLKALNAEASFLSRLFSGSAKDKLKTAQSSITRAVNQIKGLTEDDSSALAKLQKRLSERDEMIKELEQRKQDEAQKASELEDKIRQIKAQTNQDEETKKQELAQAEQAQESNETNTLKLEDSLKETIAKLEDKNKFLTEKLEQNQGELKDSNKLALEFASRMKRLKYEITSK